MSSKSSKFTKQLLVQTLFAAALGAFAAFVTIAFIEIIKTLHDYIWVKGPNQISIDIDIYTVLTVTIGGVLVGLAHILFGPHPESLAEAMDRFKKTGEFDYKHIPGALLASFAALGFGAALGPEAALIAIVGGMGTWIAKKLATSRLSLSEASHIGLSASLGAVFGSIAGVVVTAKSKKKHTLENRILTYLPGLVAAVVSVLIIKSVGSGGYFNYNFLPYQFDLSDVIYVVPVSLFAALAALVFVVSKKLISEFVGKKNYHPVFTAAMSGLITGVLATFSALVLFSGHEGVQTIIDNYQYYDGNYLFTIGLTKAFVAALLLATFWKGGRFFPMIFAGAAVGLAATYYIPDIDPMVGLAAGVGGTLAVTVPKPLVVALLLLLIFPPSLLVFALVGVGLGVLYSRLKPIKQLYDQA